MAEPEEVVGEDEDAGKDEDGIGQFDNGEMAQVAHVDAMAGYAHEGEEKGEAVDQGQEGLDGDDGVDEAREEFAGEDGVLFYQFGKVIKSAGYGKGKEAKAEQHSCITDKREYPHVGMMGNVSMNAKVVEAWECGAMTARSALGSFGRSAKRKVCPSFFSSLYSSVSSHL